MMTTASPCIASRPRMMARPKPCGPGLFTGVQLRHRGLHLCRMAQVWSVLPSSTTTISWGTPRNVSSRWRCLTVEAMQPSSSRAGMTMDRRERGMFRVGFWIRHEGKCYLMERCGVNEPSPYGPLESGLMAMRLRRFGHHESWNLANPRFFRGLSGSGLRQPVGMRFGVGRDFLKDAGDRSLRFPSPGLMGEGRVKDHPADVIGAGGRIAGHRVGRRSAPGTRRSVGRATSSSPRRH